MVATQDSCVRTGESKVPPQLRIFIIHSRPPLQAGKVFPTAPYDLKGPKGIEEFHDWEIRLLTNRKQLCTVASPMLNSYTPSMRPYGRNRQTDGINPSRAPLSFGKFEAIIPRLTTTGPAHNYVLISRTIDTSNDFTATRTVL